MAWTMREQLAHRDRQQDDARVIARTSVAALIAAPRAS